jgi:hypothetical protein
VKALVALTKRATRATVNELESFIVNSVVRFNNLCTVQLVAEDWKKIRRASSEKKELQHDGNLET